MLKLKLRSVWSTMAKNKSKKSIVFVAVAVVAVVLCVIALTGSAPRIRLSLAGGGKVDRKSTRLNSSHHA